MSRGGVEEHGLRQHRGRLLQLAESTSSVGNKRRSYSSQHTLFKSLQQMSPSPRLATKLLSLEEVVRKDPGYTPNIEHLVFPSRKNSVQGNMSKGKGGARAKLAEVFALTRQQPAKKQSSQESTSSTINSRQQSHRKNNKSVVVGEPVTAESVVVSVQQQQQDQQHQQQVTSQCSAALQITSDPTIMASSSYRGPNVSILHLRSTSEPWETSPARGYSTTSRTAATRTSVTPARYNSLRREPVQSQGSLSVSGGSGNCSRELSPVRWCDREVDGVYLGRSGWVQVQQRSLDENRRVAYVPPKPPVAVTSHNIPPRLKMSDFHSRSEPGKFPSVDDSTQQRPGFLPLPTEQRRTRDKPSPSSLDLHHEDPITPPPVTPIISPPPAFQDFNKRFPAPVPPPTRTRSATSKPPLLTRANAIESSPPPTPPATLNWTSNFSAQKLSPMTAVPLRPKRLTPSPVSTPQHGGIPQTKSLEDTTGIQRRTVFQKYDSSSSSSSSFGFRSLDSNIGVRIGMPRLTETDSSQGGYEDGYEEDNLSSSMNLSNYSSITMINSSPDATSIPATFHSMIPPVDRISPSSLRGRQHHRQMRRSPGSDGSNKKLGSNQVSPTSSSSSSSSRSPSTGPFRRSASHNKPAQHHREHVTPTWDGRGSRVRRSRSLQLPERKSPASSGGASPAGRPDSGHQEHRDYRDYHGKQEQPRVVVKINGDQQPRTKRHGLQRTTQSEEIQRERGRDRDREEELRREAEEEARVVTEFLYGARSREAARALIMQRCVEQRSPDPAVQVQGYSRSRGGLQRPKVLQRGVTTPSLTSLPGNNTHYHLNPCNPSTCDFWPHCAHRDGIYTTTTTKSSTPLATSPVPPPPATLRLSQSYPNTVNHSAYKEKKRDKRVECRNGYQSTRSSPASLERLEQDTSPTKHYPKRGNSLNVPSPTVESDWRLGPQCRQHSHMPMRGNVQASPQPSGLKVGLSDSSSAGSSMDVVEPETFRGLVRTSALSPEPVKVSPIEVNSVIVNAGDSSSSSSSDIWVTTSDRTMTKSPRAKSSGASTPLEDGRASKSPVRMSDEDRSRPGSAPGVQDHHTVDTQQRSLSLPKSFQSVRDVNTQPRQRRTEGARSAVHSPAPTLRPPSPELARTAPATPVRDVGLRGDTDHTDGDIGLTKNRFSSTPLLDPAEPPWDRSWAQDKNSRNSRNGSNNQRHNKEISQSQKNISGNVSESVLQKFRKSFSLRFYRSGKGGGGGEEEKEMPPPESPPPDTRLTPPLTKDDSSERFRFGPLVWRSSKERKKTKKSARNAKCNSGDSGIQIEMVGRTGGDSSESHDTDHLADEEPLDELDSPVVVRRRGTASSTESKPSRPTSDVINQILIDKLKADLQARGIPRRGHANVRRTHSDLGGQRLFNWDMRHSYRRMFSTPSPLKSKPAVSPRRGTLETPNKSYKRICGRPQQLRRSISQPLGINELSPLMRRKPSGSGRGNVLSEDERGITSEDDELLSDSESSIASLTDRKKSFEQAMDEEVVVLAEAVWDHVAMEPEELGFRAGEVVEVLDTLDRDWWWGTRGEQAGWFPSAFVRLRVSQEDTVEDCLAAIASGGSKQLRRRTSISLLSNDQVRSRVVRELLNTERDFVKVLRDVKEGYLAECRKRTDMFSEEQIGSIFGNLEQLLEFQEEFLEDLEQNVDTEAPHRSCVGDTFLTHQNGFRMYSEYCNSHPMAIATLQELYQHNSYSKFFEACRLMRGLIEIPLDGYLLTPVQRICKYPLQLAELLKYTKTDHADHAKITEALEAMRGVAVLINERKRRMESLEKLAAWQQRVDAWEGEDLIETSSQLIHQGEAIRVTSGMWTNNIVLFLFDHQLVYCKKDLLKRNSFVYKGRIQLDTSEVINLSDGKEPSLGVTVRHGIKVHSVLKDKWLLFCCRSAQDKTRWLESFAEERQLVAQDLRDGLEFAPAARHLARMSAVRCHQRRPPTKPRNKAYKRGNSDVTFSQRTNGVSSASADQGSTNSLGRRVGTWFTFGGHKKSRNLGRAATLQTVVHPT